MILLYHFCKAVDAQSDVTGSVHILQYYKRYMCQNKSRQRHQLLTSLFVCLCFQGARVWVREKEQLVPATVNSCGDGTLVLTTDYGEVRSVERTRNLVQHHLLMCTKEQCCLARLNPTFWIFLDNLYRYLSDILNKIYVFLAIAK